MTRRTKRRLIAIAVVLIVMLIAGTLTLLWFVPTGTGESRHSPDGRYTAQVSNMSVGTFTAGQDRYTEVRVVEAATGREVWRVVHRPPQGTDVPEYGDRAERFIRWTTDSTR